MATLSTVAVDFVANTSKYTDGLKKISSETKRTTDGISKNFSSTKDSIGKISNSFEGITSVISKVQGAIAGAAIIEFGKKVLETASKISDMSEELNVGTTSLQKYESLFQKNGQTIDDVRQVFVKLQKGAFDASEGNTQLAEKFARLGIVASDFIKLSPDEQMKTFADAISRVQNPTERLAIAQELLGKQGSRAVSSLLELSKIGGIDGEISGIVVVTKEANNAVKEFADGAQIAATNILRLATEGFGRLLIAQKELADQNKKMNAGNATPNAFMMQGGIGGPGSQVKAAMDEADRALKERVKTFEELQQAETDAAIALEMQAEAEYKASEAMRVYNDLLRQKRDAVMASVDPDAKYRSEIDKINKVVEQNKLSEADRKKLIEGISQAYIFAVEPAKKYEAEIAKINADKGLSDQQKKDNVRLLARQYMDIIDPAEKYRLLNADLNALLGKGIITDQEKAKVLDDIGSSYRALYDPAEKYRKLQRELFSKPAGSNFDIVQVIKNAGKEFVDILNPMDEFDKKIKEAEAFFKSMYDTEKAILDQVIRGYEKNGELTQGRIDLYKKEEAALYAKNSAELKVVGDSITLAKKATFERELGALANDKILTAESIRTEQLLKLERLKRMEQQKGSTLTLSDKLKEQIALQIEVDYYKAVNTEIVKGFEYLGEFADQFSRAIVSGQNFGDALKNTFQSIVKDIAALILRMTILKSIMAAIGIITPTGAEAFAQLTGIAKGGIPRASGGPVMAGESYRIGEAGPETFVPSSNGYILPNDMAPSETVIVNQTINVQTGVSQTVRSELAAFLPRFKQEAIAGVLEAKQRGGSYAKGLSAA